jgi:hypothetical protein
MPTYADRVKEGTTTAGTGTLTLNGAKVGFQSFANAFADQDIVYYAIFDGTNWEVGQGTFTLAGTLLSRDTVVASSNAGALVNFPAGGDVWCDRPATAVPGMTKNSLATKDVIRVAQDDNMIYFQDVVCSGTSDVLGAGGSDWAGIG